LLLGCSSPPATCVLLLTAAALGCSPPPVCATVPIAPDNSDPGGVEGQTITIDMSSGLTVPGGCQVPNVTSVSGEVHDPDNNLVPSTTTFSPADLPETKAHVTFTPPRFGQYHLTVRFEPSFDTQQTDLLVARDRSDAGFHSMPAPANCPAFAVAAGFPLCHDELERLTAFSPDGGTTQVSATRFSVDEAGRVWTIGIGGPAAPLVVYALDGGAFEQLALAPGENDEPKALVARGGRAVVIRTDVAELWELDGGSLQDVQGTGDITPFGLTPQWCVSFNPPAQFAAVDVSSLRTPLLLFDGTNVQQQTRPLSGPVLNPSAADDFGVWWTDSTRLNCERPVLKNGAFVVATAPYALSLFSPSPVCPESERSPILQTNQFVPSLGPDGIILDKFPAAPGTLLGATPHIVWGVDQGQLVWWDR